MRESWGRVLTTAGGFMRGTWTGADGGCLSHSSVFRTIMCNALLMEQHVNMSVCLWLLLEHEAFSRGQFNVVLFRTSVIIKGLLVITSSYFTL